MFAEVEVTLASNEKSKKHKRLINFNHIGDILPRDAFSCYLYFADRSSPEYIAYINFDELKAMLTYDGAL